MRSAGDVPADQKNRRDKPMKKIFISQPMKGLTNEEIKYRRMEAIKWLEKFMRGEEFEIIDSFFEDAPVDAKPLWYLGESLKKLSTADYALFLQGWDKARGCKIENTCAQEYGIQTIYENRELSKKYYVNAEGEVITYIVEPWGVNKMHLIMESDPTQVAEFTHEELASLRNMYDSKENAEIRAAEIKRKAWCP